MRNYSIDLYKTGKLYNSFNDDGIIIHYLLGYKYVDYKKSIGFPESALNKVKEVLEKNKLSYKIYEKSTMITEYKGINKNYNIVLKKALNNLEIETRVNRLKEKIENLNTQELENIIEAIENGNF